MYKRLIIAGLSMLTVILINAGCSADSDYTETRTTRNADAETIPVMLLADSSDNSNMKDSHNRELLCHWNPESDSITFEVFGGIDTVTARSLWERGNSRESKSGLESSSTGNSMTARFKPSQAKTMTEDGLYLERGSIAVETSNGQRVEEFLLEPEIPENASGPYPLLLSGTTRDFRILAAYDHSSKDKTGAIVGHLILGSMRSSKVEWLDIRGDYCSFIAGDGADSVSLDDKIFIVACGNSVMMLDLKRNPEKLVSYKSANQLISKIEDKYSDIPLKISLGAYKHLLLVSAQGVDEQWAWAFQDDSLIGGLYIKNEKLLLYNEDYVAVAQEVLTNPQVGIVLPDPGNNIGR